MGRSVVTTKSYKDLIVWNKAFELTLLIYKITKNFPKTEIYGLISQIRRCVISIPSNIAEGYSRHRKLEYIQYLQIAFASSAELETQLLISNKLNYISDKEFKKINRLLQEVMKMLNSLIRKIKISAS